MTSKKMIAICLLANPFKTSSGIKIPETRKTKTTPRNNTDDRAQFLYKAMMSKTIVANTIYGGMLMVIIVLQATRLYYKTNTISFSNKRHVSNHMYQTAYKAIKGIAD